MVWLKMTLIFFLVVVSGLLVLFLFGAGFSPLIPTLGYLPISPLWAWLTIPLAVLIDAAIFAAWVANADKIWKWIG